jgi:hypothetical protein
VVSEHTSIVRHRDYANEDLVRRGVPRGALIESGLMTSNTVEDAIAVSDYVDHHKIKDAKVLTSRFHFKRASLIFLCVMPPSGLSFLPAPDPDDLDPAIHAHEKVATGAIMGQGGVKYGSRFYPFPHSMSSPRSDG